MNTHPTGSRCRGRARSHCGRPTREGCLSWSRRTVPLERTCRSSITSWGCASITLAIHGRPRSRADHRSGTTVDAYGPAAGRGVMPMPATHPAGENCLHDRRRVRGPCATPARSWQLHPGSVDARELGDRFPCPDGAEPPGSTPTCFGFAAPPSRCESSLRSTVCAVPPGCLRAAAHRGHAKRWLPDRERTSTSHHATSIRAVR